MTGLFSAGMQILLIVLIIYSQLLDNLNAAISGNFTDCVHTKLPGTYMCFSIAITFQETEHIVPVCVFMLKQLCISLHMSNIKHVGTSHGLFFSTRSKNYFQRWFPFFLIHVPYVYMALIIPITLIIVLIYFS